MRRALVVLAVLAAGLATAAEARATPLVAVTCNGSPVCSGWFTTPVTLDWTWSAGTVVNGCSDNTYSGDTTGNQHGCIVTGDGQTVQLTVVIRIDRTPPEVTGARPDRSTDAAGWYARPVHVTFSGADATSGVAACTATTYAGPDAAGARVTGRCRDAAGNLSAPLDFPLRYDATPPDVTGVTPERRPDHRRWYTRPVTFAVAGADALSGVAACAPVTFAGPDGAAAPLVATCTDRAGNTASRAFPIRYDGTPPSVAAGTARAGDRVVRLRWPAAASAKVVRRPGVGGAARSVLLDGGADELVDRRVANGRRYRYRITLTDRVGNSASRVIRVVPGPRVLGPEADAQVTAPPRLRWTPVRGADYYNVQLFRGGRKVLSAWPRRAALRLPDEWRFRGRRRALAAGEYRWHVWPGFGPRAAARYGRRIGRGSFTVVAPPASAARW